LNGAGFVAAWLAAAVVTRTAPAVTATNNFFVAAFIHYLLYYQFTLNWF
jgi:hypothetical protein